MLPDQVGNRGLFRTAVKLVGPAGIHDLVKGPAQETVARLDIVQLGETVDFFLEFQPGRYFKNTHQRGIKIGDDALDYILDQILEMLMHSQNVEEVFAEDHVLRRRMRPFINKSADADQSIEAEVRSKLKHVQEGSRVWEIEYQRMKEDIKRRRGM